MSRTLQSGDVFHAPSGWKVYGPRPDNEVYSNVDNFSEMVPSAETTLRKDEAGDYVVTRTSYGGGGTAHGPHDVFPDGHKVIAQKLKDGKYDPNGIEISFYQSGSFTVMHTEEIPVIRKMKMEFV